MFHTNKATWQTAPVKGAEHAQVNPGKFGDGVQTPLF